MKQQGVSLIEAMVAIAILAAGLLSLGALQAKSVMMNQSAHYRSVAASLASDLADRIRANRSPYIASPDSAGDFPVKPPDFANCPQNSSKDTAPSCTAQSIPSGQVTARNAYLVQAEMTAWNTSLRSQLPNGSYSLTSADAHNGFLRYTLTLTWTDDRSKSDTAANSTYTAVIE